MMKGTVNLCVKRLLLTGVLMLFVMRFIAVEECLGQRRGSDMRFGVWWWSVDNLADLSYLDFAKEQGITEIYLNQHHLSVVNPNGIFGPIGTAEVVIPTKEFIEEASARGIAVYLLLSNTGSWLYEEYRQHFHHIMTGFLAYQQLVHEDARFAGLHFNVEPNQLEKDCGTRFWTEGYATQSRLMQQLIDFAVMATDEYGKFTTIDWATGFWWQNFTVDYRGEEMPLHQALILESDTTFVMSFRNTAEGMVEVARDHLDFAQEVGKDIFLGANIASTEGLEIDQFYHLGRAHLDEQLALIYSLHPYEHIHLVIHEISRWRHWQMER